MNGLRIEANNQFIDKWYRTNGAVASTIGQILSVSCVTDLGLPPTSTACSYTDVERAERNCVDELQGLRCIHNNTFCMLLQVYLAV